MWLIERHMPCCQTASRQQSMPRTLPSSLLQTQSILLPARIIEPLLSLQSFHEGTWTSEKQSRWPHCIARRSSAPRPTCSPRSKRPRLVLDILTYMTSLTNFQDVLIVNSFTWMPRWSQCFKSLFKDRSDLFKTSFTSIYLNLPLGTIIL